MSDSAASLPPFKPVLRDHFIDPRRTECHQAEALAAQLNKLWRAHGHEINARAVFIARDQCWTVVSDLVNGKPPARQTAARATVAA